jgi:hypothetical protein
VAQSTGYVDHDAVRESWKVPARLVRREPRPGRPAASSPPYELARGSLEEMIRHAIVRGENATRLEQGRLSIELEERAPLAWLEIHELSKMASFPIEI